jgi:hypothetical protein
MKEPKVQNQSMIQTQAILSKKIKIIALMCRKFR